jgi:HK97 gp10 family phage protein
MRSRLHPTAIAALNGHPAVLAAERRVADAIVDDAQHRAPRDTGAGADSIHAEEVDGVWRVGWDAAHDYMRFPEFGTERMPAQPFLRPAAAAATKN